MVKRQKEKQYLSARESRSYQSIRSGSAGAGATTSSGHTRPLPFHVCALSLNAYTDPVATPSGVIFDASVITPHLIKTGKDPVTGAKLSTRDLITLVMDKNEETGRWQCPVLEKAFTDRTKVVAVRQNPPGNVANVYSYEAVNELNFKPRNYIDLTSGLKFNKTKDVILLQDPDNVELCRLRDINNFAHISTKRSDNDTAATAAAVGSGDVRHSVTATRIMEKIKRKREEESEAEEKKRRLVLQGSAATAAAAASGPSSGTSSGAKIYTTDLLGTSMTSGKASSSLTSTAVEIANVNDIREATAEEILESRFRAMRKLKKKGFVRLNTNRGVIDLEIHADMVPRTAANFLGLVEAGKYDGSVFHRVIKHFMAQGGKPASKSEKEESLWGEPFADEFDDRLSHSGAGILSMANAGPATNKRQFFLTFKSCTHLDRKHSVFGRVVKGLDVLKAIEMVATGKGDRPVDDIKILAAEILGTNPAKEAEEAERIRIEERAEARVREKDERKSSALGRDNKQGASVAAIEAAAAAAEAKSSAASKPSGVGKYLPKGTLVQSLDALGGRSSTDKGRSALPGVGSGSGDIAALPGVTAAVAASRKPKAQPKKTKQWDFSGW
mmetsp:Transcript_6082/g.13254  ORF Transcript_6082/g.13254 Transcript_6082/m.13254 type:complete len:613 (-) Transcript_6082:69-1907(-)